MAEASVSGWTAALSSAEARTAAAYATIELNGFAPFISDLAVSHPKEVESVIGGEVSAELRVGGSHGHLSTLQNLSYADSKLKQLVIPRMIAELASWPHAFTEDTLRNGRTSGSRIAHFTQHSGRGGPPSNRAGVCQAV